MSKEEILAEFEIDFKSPGSKYGEYLYQDVIKRAKDLILKDRLGVIEACKYWFSLRKEPYTMLAVDLANNLHITELKPELENLKKNIASGKIFLPYYAEGVDKALNAIS